MNVLVLLFSGIALFVFGYFVYSRFVAGKILGLDDANVTPAHRLRDDIDYVPANRYILWGHHFTAVAGAAPIVGPAIAVQWGYLPAFLWVILGTVFFAGIHDMCALFASVRHDGKSIGTVCRKVVGNRVGQLFIVVIFLVLLMVNGAFGVIIAHESVFKPATIIPAWGAIAIALIMGQLIYKLKWNLLLVTALAVIALYALVPLGVAYPVNLPETFMGLNNFKQWIVILFIYAGIASVLPVWMLLQPRDYVNGIQLFIALALLYISIVIVSPPVIAPAITSNVIDNWHILIPALFVTVACGAISGFHGIVSSGTTSKQVDKEKDVRFVGYLGAMGEGSLSLATIIACVAGISLIGGNEALNPDTWMSLYKGGVLNFVNGGGAIIAKGIGLPQDIASTLLSLMVILFAATTMDAGIRLQRYIVQEWGEIYGIGIFRSKYVSTIIAVVLSFLLAYNGVGDTGGNEVAIWPLFGATNQLLASLTLLVVGVILLRMKKGAGSLVVFIPMVFILTMSFWAAILKLGSYYKAGNYLLFGIDMVVIIVTVLVILNGLSVIAKLLGGKDPAPNDV